MHALSDERCEYLIKDRLSFMRFLGLGLVDPVPDANTIWTFREALKKAAAVDSLFQRFDEALRSEGFLAMSGQIVDATIVAAPKQRNTIEEKKAIKEGRVPDAWKNKPKKLAQRDRDARWTVRYAKAKPREDGSLPSVDLAIPAFGYKNHVSIDRAFGLIRKWTTTDAAAHDGARLEDVLDRTNTVGDVWAKRARFRRAMLDGMANGGGCRLSVGEERGDAGAAWVRLSPPSQETGGSVNARAHPGRQRPEIEGAQRDRARLRAPEGPDGSRRLHDRDRASPREDRAREPLLQHAPLRMAEDEIHGRMTDKAARGAVSKPDQNHKPIKIIAEVL